jgi:NhaP-type Na+/H+ or K+/H+ antiporter
VPVATALAGTGARRQTVGFLGWFGPRGLASIVFAVLVVEEHGTLPNESTILTTIYATIGLSVLLHGLSAAPLARRYAAWYAAHPTEAALRAEAGALPESRWRLQRSPDHGHSPVAGDAGAQSGA